MINSRFSLDHRLNELRASEADLRLASQLRDATTNRPATSVSVPTQKRGGSVAILSHLSRLAAI